MNERTIRTEAEAAVADCRQSLERTGLAVAACLDETAALCGRLLDDPEAVQTLEPEELRQLIAAAQLGVLTIHAGKLHRMLARLSCHERN